MAGELPAGFTVDQPTTQAVSPVLPSGFTVDAPQPQLPDTTNIEKTAQDNVAAQESNATPQTPVQNLTTALGHNPVAPYQQGGVIPQPIVQHVMDCYKNGTATTAADCMQSTVPQVAASIQPNKENAPLQADSPAVSFLKGLGISSPQILTSIPAFTATSALTAKTLAPLAKNRVSALAVGATSIVAGTLAAMAASGITKEGQDAFLKAHPEMANAAGISQEQLALDLREHPWAFKAGTAASNLIAFKPGISSLKQMLVNAGIMGGTEAGREVVSGEKVDPLNVLAQAATGAIMKNNAFGEKLSSLGEGMAAKISAGYDALRPAVAQQMNVPPNEVTNSHIDNAVSASYPHEAIPHAIDYDHAATVMFGEDGAAKGADLLREITAKTSGQIRPEQVFEDAHNDPELMQQLREGTFPKAYDYLVEKPSIAEKTTESVISENKLSNFKDMTKEQFMGDVKEVPSGTDSNMKLVDLPSTKSAESEPFMNGKYTIKNGEFGSSVYDGDKLIASYNNDNDLVTDPAYRNQGIAEELLYQRTKGTGGAPKPTQLTPESRRIYERVFDRLNSESNTQQAIPMTESEEAARNRRIFNMGEIKSETPEPKTPDQLVNPDFAKEDKEPPSLFGKLSKAISDMISVNPAIRAEAKNLSDLGKVAEEDPVMAGKIAARYIHETLSPDTVSGTAEDAATILKERLGVAARETAVAQNALNRVWRSAGKLVGEVKDQFIDYMQNRSSGATIDPALQETADVVRKINQDIEAKLQALPGNEQRAFIKDYFTQNWKDTAISRRVMNEAIARQGSGRNLEQRIIPSHAEGIALGLEDKFDHPLETVMNYVKNVQKYIAHVEAVNDMIEGGMAKRFKGDEDTTGYTKLDGTVGSDNGEGAVYAQDDAARIYNNAISKGFEGGAGEIFKAINFSSNVLRRMKLGLLNFFHAGVITQASMSSEFGLGTKEITGAFDKDNPQSSGLSIIKGAARMSLSTLAPFKHLAEGGKGLQEYKAPGSTDPRTQQIIDVLSRANAITSSMPEYMKSGAQVDLWDGWKRGDFDNFADKASDFVNNLTLKNAAVKIPKLMFQTVARAMDTTVKPLFDWYTPRMKTGAAMESMGQFMDTHPNATHEEQLQAASAIGDSIDNRMGEMMTQNLFLNRKLEQSINQGFLSYGWVLGQLRGGIGGAKDIAMFKNTPNAQYIIGTIATTALLNTLYQYLHTGKPPQDLKDLMAPKTGGIQNAGGEIVPEREFGPSHESQWYHYANDFTGELFGNEANPLIPFVKMLATGKNWADQDVTDRNDPKAMDYIRAMGDQMEPIMLSTLEKGAKKGSHLTTTERALGFRQVPAFVANPEGVKEQTEERNERNWEKSQKFDEKQKESYEQ